jgi:hypothetical protein
LFKRQLRINPKVGVYLSNAKTRGEELEKLRMILLGKRSLALATIEKLAGALEISTSENFKSEFRQLYI